MAGSGIWRDARPFDVANGTPANFVLTFQGALERLTIWAVSGERVLTNMTFQPQLNGTNFGPAENIVGAVAADVIFQSGGAATENIILPSRRWTESQGTPLDDFVFRVRITNNAAGTTQRVTLYAVGIEHVG